MSPKPITIDVELDSSSLMTILDDIAEHIPPETPNEELYRFIRAASLVKCSAIRTGKPSLFFWTPKPRYLELLPALKAGDLNFCALNDLLNAEIGVRNESDHEHVPPVGA